MKARDRTWTYPLPGASDSPGAPPLVWTRRARFLAGALIGVLLVLLLVASCVIGDQMRCDRLAPTGVDHDERAFRYYCTDTT